jgi:hypothetical protein
MNIYYYQNLSEIELPDDVIKKKAFVPRDGDMKSPTAALVKARNPYHIFWRKEDKHMTIKDMDFHQLRKAIIDSYHKKNMSNQKLNNKHLDLIKRIPSYKKKRKGASSGTCL